GLQRAFQTAGTRSVVASLWKVPDRATQELMTRFYHNFWQKKLSKVEALRQAQVWLLREGAKGPGLLRGLERPGREPVRKGGGAECHRSSGLRLCCRVTGAEGVATRGPRVGWAYPLSRKRLR